MSCHVTYVTSWIPGLSLLGDPERERLRSLLLLAWNGHFLRWFRKKRSITNSTQKWLNWETNDCWHPHVCSFLDILKRKEDQLGEQSMCWRSFSKKAFVEKMSFGLTQTFHLELSILHRLKHWLGRQIQFLSEMMEILVIHREIQIAVTCIPIQQNESSCFVSFLIKIH